MRLIPAVACTALTFSQPAYSKQADHLRAPPLVQIKVRTPYEVCAGVCPWYALAVDSRRRVVIRLHDGKTYTYRASAGQLEGFQTLLQRIRPRGYRPLDQTCRFGENASIASPNDIEIRWFGADPSRLTSCFWTKSLRIDVFKAVDALGTSSQTGIPEAAMRRIRQSSPITWG